MNKTDNATLVGVHKFEAAGLGKAPFKFIGVAENAFVVGVGDDAYTKAGGSCDYCSASIRYEYRLRSADGKTFKVGCDCIEKAGDHGILKAYKSSPEYRTAQREKANARGMVVYTELKALIEARKSELAAKPHPRGFTDRKTGLPLTYLDQVEWLFNNSGRAGRASLLKSLKTL